MTAKVGISFADLLRRYRRQRNLTQEELAERAGISSAAISMLERGLTQVPQRATLHLLSTALALTPDAAAAFADAARRGFRHVGDNPGDASTDASIKTVDGGLPVPLTPLVGRTCDEATLIELVERPSTRLLTLIGPAGVGKTRLALELAAMLRGERRRDVIFVGLIPVQEHTRVLPAIAQALGVQDSGRLALRDSLVHALVERHLLMVLDNFEHVLPAAREVLDLLVACPHVTALITSRSALNVRGERCYRVSPLALPEPAHMESIAGLCQVPAVALFIERAVAAQPDFAIATLEDGRLASAICARLDGLPLAIELAAARVRSFGLRQLHDRLARPGLLGVLTDGPRDLADHQRTMRSTIAWSYALLGEPEQRLFRWLGTFVGGASVVAAETVSGVVDETLLASFAGLVDASLLQYEDGPEGRRYSQLVTLRAYAQERLRAEREWDDARRRHAEYFLGLVELIDTRGTEQRPGVMARVETEYENIRAALVWALETDEIAHGLRMVGALWRFWFTHTHFLEGLEWLEQFVARAGIPQSSEEKAELAQALTGIMAISHRLDRFERAVQAGEKALALRREIGDQVEIAHALNNLANPVAQLHDYARAVALYKECIALQREAGNPAGIIVPLLNLGGLHHATNQPQNALAYYEQSLALSHELGESDAARALTWADIGEVYIILDEPTRAIAAAEPSYHIFACEHDSYGMAITALTLGRAHWRVGNTDAARARLAESERLFRALGNPIMTARVRYFSASLALDQSDVVTACRDLAQALADLTGQARENEYVWCLVERAGALACRCGHSDVSAKLYGAAIVHRGAQPRPLEPAEREARTRDLDNLRTALGETKLALCLAQGQELCLKNAVALVYDELRQATE